MMTYKKPKPPQNQLSDKKFNEILELIVKDYIDRDERKNKALEKVDENTTRQLSNIVTFRYYLLSITTACIAFAISLTINQKFNWIDIGIILSMALWIISFSSGMAEVGRNNNMMTAFNYYILGEVTKNEEIITKHKKILDDIGNEKSADKNIQLWYFIFGCIAFMLWYILKLFTN